MGGLVFSNVSGMAIALRTPRMPPDVYFEVRDRCQKLLSLDYTHVGTPVEVPGKEDHGDVDILVASPINSHLSLDDMAQRLGAVHTIIRTPIRHFAVPWPVQFQTPTELAESARIDDTKAGVEESETQACYIQVDVHICKDKAEFDWEIFHEAHGDLWNMLGSTIRRFGFTVNNVGLYLRIPEIEKENRKKSLVCLSSSPDEVLTFLGMDTERWERPFESQQELFEYAASCRFFWVKRTSDEAEQLKNLKSNDRQRLQKRPVFRAWMEEFIPSCRREGRFTNEPLPRPEATEQALKRFGVQRAYDERLAFWEMQKSRIDALNAIKAFQPLTEIPPQPRGVLIKAFKDIVFEDKELDICLTRRKFKSSTEEGEIFDVEELKRFIEENWRSVAEKLWGKDELMLILSEIEAKVSCDDPNKDKEST